MKTYDQAQWDKKTQKQQSKVGDRSSGWPEGPLFNSYDTDV